MQSLGICLALQGHFYDQSPAKSPAQILAGKCEITPADLGMELKALQFHGTAGMRLSAKHGTFGLWHLTHKEPCEQNISGTA